MADRPHDVSAYHLDASDGGQCRVTRIQPATAATGPPVVYLPGMFTDRGFWHSERGVGLAGYLADHGFPGMIVERREQSGSARPGLEEHLHYDLPAVQAETERLWGQAAFWMGHSFGGVLAARACCECLDISRVRGLVLFASQFEVGKRGLRPPWSWLVTALSRRLGYFPAKRFGLGPKDEPPETMADAAAIVTQGRRHPLLRQRLRDIEVPTLALSGLGDRVDPTAGCERFVGHFASRDKHFIAAGLHNGFRRDYGHADLVVSKDASAEIWPIVRAWLQERAAH